MSNKPSLLFYMACVFGTVVLPQNAASAVLSIWFLPAAVSIKPAAGVLAAGSAIALKGNKDVRQGGLVIAAGGAAVVLFDPPSGRFYDGSFTVKYDPSLLSLAREGWLGSWGLEPSLPRPAVNGYEIPEMLVNLQPPNSGLVQTIFDDPVKGEYTVSFNWGPDGHTEESGDPFNFYAMAFVAKVPIEIDWGGTLPQFGPLDIDAGSNDGSISVSSPGIRCQINDLRGYCGEDTKDLWVVGARVPEPAV